MGAAERVQVGVGAEGSRVYGVRWVKLPIWQWNAQPSFVKVDPIFYPQMRALNRGAAPIRPAGRGRPVRQ
jgi:hypothetical protein